MAYDVELADRLRRILGGETGLTERRMFGGLAFMIEGRMAVCAGDDGLLLRIDPADGESLVREPHASYFRMRGRELAGWLHIATATLGTDDNLRRWANLGVVYARSLPPT